jgi:hypothetical protein
MWLCKMLNLSPDLLSRSTKLFYEREMAGNQSCRLSFTSGMFSLYLNMHADSSTNMGDQRELSSNVFIFLSSDRHRQ